MSGEGSMDMSDSDREPGTGGDSRDLPDVGISQQTAADDSYGRPGADDPLRQSGADVSSSSSSKDMPSDELAVYVCGAVHNPGVYYLPGGARICDAIEASGGFSQSADTEWLNQAKLLTDGEMLIVYTKEETARMLEEGIARGGFVPSESSGSGSEPGSSGDAADAGAGRINLNTASKEQLMTLPGIGEAKADAIIRYRTETGLFASTEDVMNISGIKNSIYDKIRDLVTV